MSDWSYVAIAYTVAWGGIALYGLALARRVYQANLLERQLRGLTDAPVAETDTQCDDAARS